MCNELAAELLDRCLKGQAWPREWPRRLAAPECAGALFRIVVEGLSDRFEPALCDACAEVMAEAMGGDAAATLESYRRVRMPRTCGARGVENVFVLSRVTLGADVAVTSVVLDAAKRHFPRARIFLVGSRKNAELFAADPRIGHLEAPYPRGGSFAERLAASYALREMLTPPASVVIDPGSRLSQLGLVPVCEERNYYFFESRSYGGAGEETLRELTRRWMAETFGAEGEAYIAPAPASPPPTPFIAMSLGVGGNPEKRIEGSFEEDLVRALADRGHMVLIDQGAGGEETERVQRIAGRTGALTWQGAFAPFAARVAAAALYIGYDSAGQHVAAACGVPLVTVFKGFPTARMFHRWKPSGPGRIEIVRVEDEGEHALDLTLSAASRLLGVR